MQSQFQSPAKPMSAARLAAEQAFMSLRAESDIPAAAASPVVTVMARRLGVFAPFEHSRESAELELESPAGQSVPEPRPPRVFLIGGANSRAVERAAEPDHTAQMNPMVLQLEHRRVDSPIRRTSAKRDRNRAAPVTVIYPAMPAAQPPESDQHLKGGMPSVADGPPQKNAASLAKALAEIEPIVAAIREAIAFRFDGPASAREWQRLSTARTRGENSRSDDLTV